MVFKLVRVDAEEPNKIRLPLGTHLIGRGKFLDCDDKRISRNHGHLIITEDSVVIEALHQNPCFFTRKCSEEKQVVKKSCKEKLDNGDRFGLLPGSYWYEVLYCRPDTDSQATDVSNTQELEMPEARTDQEINDKTLSENVSCNVNEGEKSNEKEDNEDSLLDFDLNETVEVACRTESPSLLDQQNEPQQDSANQSMSISPTPATDPPETRPKEPETNPTEQESPSSPNPTVEKSPKRSHSMDADDGVKRIKTEPADVKEELLVKTEPDAGDAGASSSVADQAGASNAADGGKVPPSPASPSPPPPRERCIYGVDCYRRNPVHKAQFAHPRDADWGAGERAPCPYGAACRKREPRHWRVHAHPPGTRGPDAHPPPAGAGERAPCPYGAACRKREPRHWRVHAHPPGTRAPDAHPPPGAQVVERHGRVFYINAHAVNFYDDHFQVEDEDGDSVDFDYEF